jgi:hypothetical protein
MREPKTFWRISSPGRTVKESGRHNRLTSRLTVKRQKHIERRQSVNKQAVLGLFLNYRARVCLAQEKESFQGRHRGMQLRVGRSLNIFACNRFTG